MKNSNEDKSKQLGRGKEYVANMLGLDVSQLQLKSNWSRLIANRIGELVETEKIGDEDGPTYLYIKDFENMALYHATHNDDALIL